MNQELLELMEQYKNDKTMTRMLKMIARKPDKEQKKAIDQIKFLAEFWKAQQKQEVAK